MRIGIIGCGIAGQTSAIALARDGHEVTVFERFDAPSLSAPDFFLQPSGLAVLQRLSLLEAAQSWGAPIERLYGRSIDGRSVMDLHYDDIAPGTRGLGIHRGALFGLLYDAMRATGAELRSGFEVAGIENFGRPRLICQDGQSAGPFDLVLDCAGAHHSICATMGMRSKNQEYDWCALWAVRPDRTNAFQGTLRQVYAKASLMIGILPIGRGPQTGFAGNHVAFFWSLKRSEFEAQRAAGLGALKQRVSRAWPKAAPILEEICNFDALSLATYCDARMRQFHAGCVLAIGDAAHATSPQLGQGANLALIDAYTLAYTLKTARSTNEALALYERLRRPHIRFYQIASRALTPLFQSDSHLAPAVRDLLFGPLGRFPPARHITRTTLAGVRQFPWGTWKRQD